MRVRCCGIAGLVLVVVSALPSAQAVPLDDVLARVAAYVGDFIPRYANVVAAENYEQYTFISASMLFGPTRQRVVRRLRSDLLLVRYPGGELDWMMFRDVAEVDAKPVSHPEGRLLRLFTEPVPDPAEKAARIALDGARYHIPGGPVAVTNPLLVVALAQQHYQARLRFTLGGEERSLGAGVRVLRFEEREASQPRADDEARPREKAPALLVDGRVRGNVWVEMATGRIVKTEARIGTGVDLSTTITTFVPDQRLDIMVPREMQTTWLYRRHPQDVTGAIVNGVATYGDFRRFDVRTDAAVAQPPQP